MAIVYLSLGSNMGDRMANLKVALNLLENKGLKIVKKSGVFETEPVGMKEQHDFYNMCVEAELNMPAEALLTIINMTEFEMGRTKQEHWGPRIIDIDILFYSNIIIYSLELMVPHPEIEKRKFVLEPLSEIASGFKHPVNGLTIKELLNKGNFKEHTQRIGELS